MRNNKLSNYIYPSDEVGSGIGDDHIQVLEAGVREGLRLAREAGNLDSKLLSRLESILVDIHFVTEELENLLCEVEGSLAQEGQPLFITTPKNDKKRGEDVGEVVA